MSDENNTTPALTDVIRRGAQSVVNNLHTSLIAVVVSYDADACTATVQPVNDEFYADGTTTKAPQLSNLPVMFPTYGDFQIKSDLKVGQSVHVIFAETSIDDWYENQGTSLKPLDRRRFSLRDGIVYAGLSPSWDVEASTPNLTVGNALGGLVVSPTGKVSLGSNAVDLVDVLKDLITTLQSMLIATALGPQPADPATQIELAALLVKINSILI